MALGKGLSALIPEKTQIGAGDTKQSGVIIELATSRIKDNHLQPRQNYNTERLSELAASIKEKGFLQPIVVRKFQEGYEVVAGERRLKAARQIGLETVPAIVKEATDKEALELALVENMQREDLNPIEKAISYQRFIEDFGYSQEEIARAIGKDRVTVANAIRLLKLPAEIRQALIDGKVTEGHARALLAIEDMNTQMMIFVEVLNKALSVRDVEALVKKQNSGLKDNNKNKAVHKDPEISSLEEELRRLLGTKVLVENRRGNKGRIVIEYYSLNDIDRILAMVRK